MNFNIQVRRAAELDLAEAEIWYENQRPGLGAEFLSEISRIFTVLGQTPLLYPVLHRDVRRAIVPRFPYLLWYRVMNQNVTVLACTHVRQDPEKVIKRLR